MGAFLTYMPVLPVSLWRDNNHIPIQQDGVVSTNQITLTGSNATVVTPLFHIVGSVEVRGIWGVVTTALGVNHTAAAFRLNDQTSQLNITLNTGVDISAAPAGSLIVKKGLAAAALTLKSSVAGAVSEPTTLETAFFSPIVLTKKNGATTDIEYVYATTDTPTSGVIQFFVRWYPLTLDAAVVAI